MSGKISNREPKPYMHLCLDSVRNSVKLVLDGGCGAYPALVLLVCFESMLSHTVDYVYSVYTVYTAYAKTSTLRVEFVTV